MTEALATGRIVWGHPTKSRPKKHGEGPFKGQPMIENGVPVVEWSFGLAIPKLTTIQQMGGDPSIAFENAVWPAMATEIQSGYPNGTPPRFAYKYIDGDGVDSNGKPYNQREGYAGHYVLAITTNTFAPGCFKFNPQTRQYDQLSDDQIKCGDFARVAINFKINVPKSGSQNTPSIYVNPQGVELIGYGQPIMNGPDPTTLFGGQQVALPPGASATPIGGAPADMGMPMGAQPGGMPGQMPMGAQPGGMPGQMPMGAQPGGMPGQMPMGAQPGGMPGQMPMGAQPGGMPGQMPMGAQPGGMPGQMPMGAQPGGMPGQMPMGAQPGGMPGQYPPPAHDFVQQAGMMPGQMPPR